VVVVVALGLVAATVPLTMRVFFIIHVIFIIALSTPIPTYAFATIFFVIAF
jgi:hypothetical protein